MVNYDKPIPKNEFEMENWKLIPIIENQEMLVSIKDVSKDLEKILTVPKYFLQEIDGSTSDLFLRETAANLLIQASMLLPKGYQLVIWDGWRSLKVQYALFEKYKTELRRAHPNLDEEAIMCKASAFVSIPSNDPTSPPPHNTGGAIDLSISDNNILLNMGTKFDDFSEKANTRYYEKYTVDNKIPKTISVPLHNRRLLYSVMTEVGFTNYPSEWWHYDYGNQFWASASGNNNAFYGPISPDGYHNS